MNKDIAGLEIWYDSFISNPFSYVNVNSGFFNTWPNDITLLDSGVKFCTCVCAMHTCMLYMIL